MMLVVVVNMAIKQMLVVGNQTNDSWWLLGRCWLLRQS